MVEFIFDLQRFKTNNNSYTLVSGTESDDTISSYPRISGRLNEVTINAKGGNDSISNSTSDNVIIYGGDGRDTIYNSYCENVTIDAGAGNDSIYITGTGWGSYFSIDGGEGNDTISFYASTKYCTIAGGTGNDWISLSSGYSSNNVIFYNEGDGNDTIYGFDSTSTLSISGSSYSTTESGRDIIVYVGDGGSILVREAAWNSINLNIVEAVAWKLNGNIATYGTSSNTQITINGVKSLDGISLSGSTVTIANSSLNQGLVSINSGYYLALASDVTQSTSTAGSWSLSGNTATYTTPVTTAGYLLNNNQISYVTAGGGEQINISGVKSTTGLSISGNVITVANSALNQGTVTVSNSNYSLALGNDVTLSTSTAGSWSLSGTTATYKTSATSAGYSVSNNQIVYSAASGGEEVKVTGVKSLDGISINGNVITIAASALNQSNVTISDNNYTLALANDVTAPVTAEATWTLNGTMATYRGGATTAGYSLANNEIIYTPSSSGSTFMISGVTSTDGITVAGNVVTLSQSALGQSPIVINNSDYTLALADDVATPITMPAYWTISGTTATYTTAFASEGYTINNNQIGYSPASGGETFNVTGVKSTSGLSVNGNVITVAASALNQSNVAINDSNYTLEIGNDVETPSTTEASWTLSGNVATYKAAFTSAGYSVSNNQIEYTPASGGEEVQITGVKSTSGLSISGNVITVAASALNQSNVTINDNNYTLEIGNDVETPSTTAANWTLNGNVATYKAAFTSAGYSVSNNQIMYTPASGGEEVKITGVQSTAGLSISGNVITVAASALNNSNVTISEGYTLQLANDVTAPVTEDGTWTLDGTTATYRGGAVTAAGYSLVDNQIIYTPTSTGDEVQISGVKSSDGLSVNGNVVTISATALNESAVTVSDGYTLALSSDAPKSTTTPAAWTFSGDTATYKAAETFAGYTISDNKINYIPASGGETVAVKGVKSAEGLSVNGNVVTVANAALTNSNVTVSNGYTLQLASDAPTPTKTAAGWSFSGDTATYKNESTSVGYTLTDNQINYSPAIGGEEIQIKGVKSSNGISISGNTFTVANAALNQSNVTISEGYTLQLANDVATPKTTAAAWSHSGDTATYKTASTSAGYTLTNNQITYTGASGGDDIQIKGVKSADGISISGNAFTIANAALNQSTVTISNGYTLALASDVTAPNTIKESWSYNNNVATYKAAQTFAGYKLENNQITYTGASGGEEVQIKGVKSADGISVTGKVVTVAATALNNSDVTISEGYTLQLGSGITAPTTTPAGWTLSGAMATYRATSTSAGYELKNNQIVYTSASGGETVAVNGVKSLDGISLSGNVVTIGTSSLNNARVTVSDGYTLALANDVTRPATTAAGWTYRNGTATYSHEATSAGYILENNQISYVEASGSGEIEVSGVKSKDGLTLNRNTVTVAEAALNQEDITISNGYTLALEGDIKPIYTAAHFDGLTYKTASNTAGYTTDANKIKYTPAVAAKDLFTLTGVKDTNAIKIDDTKVKIPAAALNQETVTISDGYELELGEDVDISATKTGWIKIDSGNMAYQTDTTTAGYKLENNQISYVEEILGETLAEISGIDSASTPTINDSGITFAASNFEDNVAVIQSKNNNFNFMAGDYADKEFTGTDKIDKINNSGSKLAIKGGAGSDKISNSGAGVTIEGGAGDDNVTVSGGDEGGNTVVYSDGDGKDILYNFKANDTIQVMGTAQVEANIKNKDVVFKVGKGTITIRDAATLDTAITLINSEGKAISENTYTTSGIISDNKIELAESLKKPYTQAEGINEVDGSKVKGGAHITGNSTGGKILGGAGNDTLISSEGDFELTGGAGSDLFIYGGGDDTITDYNQSDRISLGTFIETGYEIDGDNLILEFGNDNALTIQNIKSKDKEITFAGKKSTVKIYTEEGVFDGKKKSLTLASGTENSYSATKTLITIDGSQVDNEITITGNKKANLIIAGKSNTTLNGVKGKDTLVGGEGEDVFIYENKSGNKTIQNYNFEDDDLISLGSGAEISQVTTKKNNVILKVGSNTITIENTEKFNFTQGDETKTYNNKMLINGDSATLSSDFKGTFDLEENEKYNHVSAELGKKAVNLIGDSGENILTGGKGKDTLNGGANQDTLDGGKGNDILWGGNDSDTFIYRAGEGTDVISDYNYDDGDILQILDKKGNEITKDAIKKWAFDGDGLTLSIKGGGKIILANFGMAETKTIKYNNTEQSF